MSRHKPVEAAKPNGKAVRDWIAFVTASLTFLGGLGSLWYATWNSRASNEQLAKVETRVIEAEGAAARVKEQIAAVDKNLSVQVKGLQTTLDVLQQVWTRNSAASSSPQVVKP